MPRDPTYANDATVRDVIESLLRRVLPSNPHGAIGRVADDIEQRLDMRRHAGKRWRELSEATGNLIAREVGLVARGLIAEARVIAADERTLH